MILPLIPIFIIFGQSVAPLVYGTIDTLEVSNVQYQVPTRTTTCITLTQLPWVNLVWETTYFSSDTERLSPVLYVTYKGQIRIGGGQIWCNFIFPLIPDRPSIKALVLARKNARWKGGCGTQHILKPIPNRGIIHTTTSEVCQGVLRL